MAAKVAPFPGGANTGGRTSRGFHRGRHLTRSGERSGPAVLAAGGGAGQIPAFVRAGARATAARPFKFGHVEELQTLRFAGRLPALSGGFHHGDEALQGAVRIGSEFLAEPKKLYDIQASFPCFDARDP